MSRTITQTMKLFSYLTLALAITLATASCKNSDNSSSNGSDSTNKASKAPKKGDLKAEITMLKDSTDAYWNGIEKITQQKYKDIERLLQEISYTEKHDVLALKKLQAELKEVSSHKLNQYTMTEAEVIQYDTAEDSLVSRCIALAARTPKIEEHTIVKSLITDINYANTDLLISYRARYMQYAQDFNAIYDDKSKKVEKLGAPYTTYQRYKYFAE